MPAGIPLGTMREEGNRSNVSPWLQLTALKKQDGLVVFVFGMRQAVQAVQAGRQAG